AFYVIGVDAGPETVECALTDLTGKILDRSSSLITKPITNEQFISNLKGNIHALLQSAEISHEKIIGIGVAMHGAVEVETGISLVAPNLNLKNIPIKFRLEEE